MFKKRKIDGDQPAFSFWSTIPGPRVVQTHPVLERDPNATLTRGLMVRDPYATQLLNGQKRWEIRGRATQIRGPIVILKSGTGRAFGTVYLTNVIGPLALEDLLDTDAITDAEREEFRDNGLPYRTTYAYQVSNPRWFENPIPYEHPSGAVTWVNLPALDLSRAKYAPPTFQANQLEVA